jgi:FPC/CPF motif-containing protein YcgG
MSWDGKERRGTKTNEYVSLQERMDSQDRILLGLRDTLIEHITESKDIGPAIKELVTLWKASKLLGAIFTALAAGAAGLWSLFVWAREHLR